MEENGSQVQTLARFTGHGLTLALATGLFLAAGWWIDGRLGTTPLFTITGAMLGAGAGFYSMIQHLVLFPQQAEEARKEKRLGESAGEEDGAPRTPSDGAGAPKDSRAGEHNQAPQDGSAP